jgi:hypothetical protein
VGRPLSQRRRAWPRSRPVLVAPGRLAVIAGLAVITGPAVIAGPVATAVELPAGWRELREINEPAAAALAAVPGATGTVSSWGNPATGSYGLVHDVRTAGPARHLSHVMERTLADVRAELQRSSATVSSWHLQRDRATIAFALAGYRAETRVQIDVEPDRTLRIRAATCFYNQRELRQSEQRCSSFFSQP